MPVSATTARITVGVPDALTLGVAQLNSVYSGAKAIGVTGVAITVPWSSVQPSRTSWSWNALDQAVFLAAQVYQLKVRLILTGPLPGWSSSLVPADYAAFASAVANRYKPAPEYTAKYRLTAAQLASAVGITTTQATAALKTVPATYVTDWQVWDEPNVIESWPTSPNAVDYAAVLTAASKALKAVRPANVVLFGGLQAAAGGPVRITRAQRSVRSTSGRATAIAPQAFLDTVYAAGGRSSFDAVVYHPLSRSTARFWRPPAPSGDSIAQSDKVRSVMRSRGDAGKKMLWTVGYDTALFSTTQQAYYLDTLRWMAERRKDHVAELCLHSYRDYQDVN